MLLPSDPRFKAQYTLDDPVQTGIHAVLRCDLDGIPNRSAAQFSYWNGTKWGPLADSPEEVKLERSRGRLRTCPLRHCYNWLDTQAGQQDKPEPKAEARPSFATMPMTARGDGALRKAIVHSLSFKRVDNFDGILSRLGQPRSRAVRRRVDAMLRSLIDNGEVVCKAAALSGGHAILFGLPMEDAPSDVQEEGAAIESAPNIPQNAVTGIPKPAVELPRAPAVTTPASIASCLDATARPTPNHARTTQPSKQLTQISPVPLLAKQGATAPRDAFTPGEHRQLLAQLRQILAAGPLCFAELVSELDQMAAHLEATPELLAAALRHMLIEGTLVLSRITADDPPAYLVKALARRTDPILVSDSAAQSAGAELLMHLALEVLHVVDLITQSELQERLSYLLPRHYVSECEVQLALEFGAEGGQVVKQGPYYSLAPDASKRHDDIVIGADHVDVRVGLVKVQLPMSIALALRDRLNQAQPAVVIA